MCTEAVVLDRTAPVIVDHAGTVFTRTDTIHPVILVGKATTRPAQIGDAEFLECAQHIVAIAIGIGNRGILTYPESTIDTGTEVFGKLAVDMTANHILTLLRMECQGGFALRYGRHGTEKCQGA